MRRLLLLAGLLIVTAISTQTIIASPAKALVIYPGNLEQVDFSKEISKGSTLADLASIKLTNYYGSAEIGLMYYKTTITNQTYDCDCTTSTITSANSTKYDSQICKTCYKLVSSTDLIPLDEKTVLAPGQPVYETFNGCKKIEPVKSGWGCSVWTDVTLIGKSIPNATWFNASFGARIPVVVSNSDNKTHINEPINITITSTGDHAIRSCQNEIALVNYSNDYVFPLSSFQVIEDGPPNCKYTILVNVTTGYNGTILWAYYNASGVTQTLGTLQLFSDNFDDGTKTNIWTDTTGDTEADGFAKLADADASRLDTNDNTTWNPTLYGGLTTFFRANTSSTTYTGVWMTLIDTGSYGSTNSSGVTDGVATAGILDYQVYIGNVGSQADLTGFTLGKGKFNYYVVQTNVTPNGGYQFVRSWGDSHDEIAGTSASKAWVKWTSARIHNQGNNNIAGWFDFIELWKGIVNYYKTPTSVSFGAEETNNADTTPPTFILWNNVTNNTVVSNKTVVGFGACWSDNIGMSNLTLSIKINNTGSWSNSTFSSFANCWTNFTNIMTPDESNISLMIFANDTSNNWNRTGPWFWWVNKTLVVTPNATVSNASFNINIELTDPTRQYCTDNTTLHKIWNYTTNLESSIVTADKKCQFGCDTVANECKMDPFWIFLGYLIGVIAVTGVFGVAYKYV